ncbi:aminopeptidase N [Microlunatus speluncae]|uniref:aminopeptidase N n=1 Tax=Microlunatus speluncae TaxID=2594267 RepID=UPI00126639E8|nr:aminopeptidase N [Microlunatus speluncae]
MFPDNLTRAEAMARSALIETSHYRIEIDLSGREVADPAATFRSTTTVSFRAREDGSLHVDAIADRVISADLDGVALDPGRFAASRLPVEVFAGDHQLTVTAEFRYSRSGLGLHRFVDPADNKIYCYSQFESAEARRVFACFEQPDLKAKMAVAVIAPRHWTVIGNGVETGRSDVAAELARWQFAETEPFSTYLVGLVAGEYERVIADRPAGTTGAPMSLLVRDSVRPHLDPEMIFEVTRGGFDVFEAAFGYPYPFGKYDQAFVPEYNMGAMENVGCIVLRDDLVFRSRVTKSAHDNRDNIVLHELAHMWFGDLVTMRWWDDLWLKESFAEWAATFAQSRLDPDPRLAWATFCNKRKTWAYRQDQLSSTHPVAADMIDLEAVEQNFDGITYAKGASVLRQLVAFVGEDAFLAGVRHYFAEHAFGNTELSDLLAALQQASGRDLSGWSAQWLEQAGVNTLRADFAVAEDETFTRFAIRQAAPAEWPTLRDHRIAIGLYRLTGDRLVRTDRIETDLAGPVTEVAELVGLTQPDLILINDDDLSYAKVRLDPRSLSTLIDNIDRFDDPLARAVCWGSAWDLCRDGELPASDYVELVLRGVAIESDLTAVDAVLAQALQAAQSYTPLDRRAATRRTWQDGLAGLLAKAEAGSDHQLALAKAYAHAALDDQAGALLRGWLDGADVPDGLAVDQDLRWILIINLARLGLIDDAVITAESARDNTITGAEQAAGARAARPDPAAKTAAWQLAVVADGVPNETQRQTCLRFNQPDQDELVRPYLADYLDAAAAMSAGTGVWATRGTSLRDNALVYLYPRLDDTGAQLDQVNDWLDRTELTPSVRRIVSERRDETARALRAQRAASGQR